MFNHRNGTLYTGMTDDVTRRVWEHKNKINPNSFSARYGCDKLGYWEEFQYVNDAIEREKHIKSQSRKYKLSLIESINPDWIDLSLQDIGKLLSSPVGKSGVNHRFKKIHEIAEG